MEAKVGSPAEIWTDYFGGKTDAHPSSLHAQRLHPNIEHNNVTEMLKLNG
jgi:hypothetical protein